MKGKDFTVAVLLDCYGAMLTDKQRDVIDLYYNEDLSLAEIAEHTLISRQGVRDSIVRGETFLREMEEKLHFAGKEASRCEKLEEIKNLADEMARLSPARAVQEKALKIYELADSVGQE